MPSCKHPNWVFRFSPALNVWGFYSSIFILLLSHFSPSCLYPSTILLDLLISSEDHQALVIPLTSSVSCLFWLFSPPCISGPSFRALHTLRPLDIRVQEICDHCSFHWLFKSSTSSLHCMVTDSYPALQVFTGLQALGLLTQPAAIHWGSCRLQHWGCVVPGQGMAQWKKTPCLFILIIIRDLFILFPDDKHTSLRA